MSHIIWTTVILYYERLIRSLRYDGFYAKLSRRTIPTKTDDPFKMKTGPNDQIINSNVVPPYNVRFAKNLITRRRRN